MELHVNDFVHIQSFKHDGSLHRTWSKAKVLEVSAQQIVAVTDRSIVVEANGRKWKTREPAVCFFYPDQWYNVICMVRKTGIHYYCNIASPSIYDGEAIKNIDYDLDVKVMPNEQVKVLDEEEYFWHARKMQYGERLDRILHNELRRLLQVIEEKKSPFRKEEVLDYFQNYLSLL